MGSDGRTLLHLLPTPERYETLFKKKKKEEEKTRGEEKKLQRNSSRARGKVHCLTQKTFYVPPPLLFFMSCNEWTEIQRPFSISHFYDCDEKKKETKLKEDEFLSVL